MTSAVLVVDDSAVVRKLIRDRLASDPTLHVVGHARDGEECLRWIERTRAADNPLDVVILDEEMPRMTGREVLRVLRRDHPNLAVVMFSAHVETGAEGTLDALFMGADDAVRKPSALGDAEHTWLELIDKVHAAIARHRRGVAGGVVAARPRRARPVVPAPVLEPTRPTTPLRAAPPRRVLPEVVVVGSSTGGPQALTTFLTDLGHVDVPVLVTQHMPPVFTRRLADRLDRQVAMDVTEAEAGVALRPGTVHVAPGDRHLLVERRGFGLVTRLTDDPPENSCRPAVDVLFRSAAAAVGPAVLAIVLTGMGQDGLEGARVVVDAGGAVVVQDESSSVVWGMPGAVAGAGLAEAVLPVTSLAAEVDLRLRLTGRALSRSAS